MVRNREAAGGDPVRIMNDGLLQLRSKGLLGQGDVEYLRRIINIISSKIAPGDMLLPVRKIYTTLIDGESSSPLALAIASIAVDSILTAMETGANRPIGADVGGVIGGALFGGLFGAIVCGALASYFAAAI